MTQSKDLARFRRAVRRCRIEAIVEVQRQTKDCAACTSICSHRVPYSIDAVVDDDTGWLCGEDLGPRQAQWMH